MRSLKQRKLCIVLDNPDRDALGMALLASFVADQGVEVILVPMYDQQQHVLSEMPDMVLVNYVRKANARAIRLYKELGIRVGVLDTEGGVLRCEYRELLNIVQSSGAMDCMDDYFLWGNRQYRAFQQALDNPSTKLYLTGCPRFDFYCEPWLSLVPDAPFDQPGYVLVATSFPLNNPRFANPEREIRNVMETMGLAREVLQSAREAADRALRGLLTVVGAACERYGNVTFVLRPHPFEDERVYSEQFAGVRNLQVRRDGTLISWLKDSACVIQLNSSIAFEAALMNKPVVSLEMYQDPLLRVDLASACSLRARSEGELWEYLDHILKRKDSEWAREAAADAQQSLDAATKDWIYSNDGRSTGRVAEHMLKILSSLPPKSKSCWRRIVPYLRVHLIYLLKLLRGSLLDTRALRNARVKRFTRETFQPLSGLFVERGLAVLDRPLGRFWPFVRSNAVLVTRAEGHRDGA